MMTKIGGDGRGAGDTRSACEAESSCWAPARTSEFLTLDRALAERFSAALRAAGIPEGFSVAPARQIVSCATLADIAEFMRVFNRVTGREAWRAAALREAPAIAQAVRREVCFFSAWDFHLTPENGFELIEFNDNGSGFLFAAIINAAGDELLGPEARIAQSPTVDAFLATIAGFIEREAANFFEEEANGLLLIVDDPESLSEGKFRDEIRLLRDLLRERGWRAEVASPSETRWNGRQLMFGAAPVAVLINRSTDFFWRSDDFAALRCAYQTGSVYAAPNPFTYATRSDKRLLEWLSSPRWDTDLGIEADERIALSAHVPETHVLRADNVDMLARRKLELVFKPAHGFASRGLLDSAAIGRARLRQLLKRGERYVAQRRVAKPSFEVEGVRLWTDLRVWAYRGEIFLMSGRASRRPDRLDLTPPGGWLPTYASP